MSKIIKTFRIPEELAELFDNLTKQVGAKQHWIIFGAATLALQMLSENQQLDLYGKVISAEVRDKMGELVAGCLFLNE